MDLLLFLQELRCGFLDSFFSFVTFLGTSGALIALFAVNYWYADKNFAYEIGASFFISGLLVQGIKITFRVPRPFVRDTRLIPVESAVSGATGYSFPSAHTQTAVSALVPAAYEYRKKKAVPVISALIILLVMLSRMYLGVHTPEDVTAAFLLSAACSAAVIFVRRKFNGNFLLLFIAAFGAASVIYAAALFSQNVIGADYLADSIKTSAAGLAFSVGIFLEKKYIGFKTDPAPLKTGIIKIIFGLAGTALLYSSKLLYENSLLLDGVRYFIVVFWITFVYPLIFSRTERNLKNDPYPLEK